VILIVAMDDNQIVLQADPQVDRSVVIRHIQVIVLMELMVVPLIQVVLM
jgi:hypothetical protein